MCRSWPVLVALIPAGIAIAGFQARPKATFGEKIAPIVKARCLPCHNAQKPSGGLDLSSAMSAKKGGNSGTIVIPGKADASLIWKRVSGDSLGPRMPMGFRPLRTEEMAAIKDWIASGASFSEDIKTHWAYIAPKSPPIPKVGGRPWTGNPIDAFVRENLRKAGLKMRPRADRGTLLRRLSLTLTGLPPTVHQLETFLTDASPDAYEGAVDKLLDSPAYGERQAQFWLDMARYADTNGYEKDGSRSAWLYRDWVIEAFNRDMPYDQFSIQQLAGDLLPNPTTKNLIATGFHRNTMLNLEGGVDPDEAMYETINDRVGTTSVVWLGQTMACARCHDHKYDPLTQEDYFRLYAFFSNNDFEPRGSAEISEMKYWEPEIRVPSEDQERKLKELDDKLKQFQDSPVPPDGSLERQIDAVNKERAKLLAEFPIALILRDKPRTSPLRAWIRVRGEYGAKSREVQAGVPAMLANSSPSIPKTRLELAKWLFSPKNPLTARVAANRIWQQHFGIGLVETADNFGTQGARPSHPELLDFLAKSYQGLFWSTKNLHRLIVTSETFMQSSTATSDAVKKDPNNRLFSRGPRFRLDAEAIRDSALVAAGLLFDRAGGPSVFPLQPDGVWNSPYSGESWKTSSGRDLYRRSLYTFWKRTAPYPSFQAFDAPSRETCTVSRSRSNTPMQALVLLNDPVFVEAAAALGARMKSIGKSDADKISFGYRAVLSRKPNSQEMQTMQKLLEKLRSRSAVDPWSQIATVLLNLDEAITVN